MPCHYPEGEATDWCERHVRDAAMVAALGPPNVRIDGEEVRRPAMRPRGFA
jgi:hypothetical protein